MPLIVEDGTGIEDADSYVSLDDARTLAASRGIVLSAVDAELSPQLISAADRVTSYEGCFTGQRVTGEQGLSYPRNNAFRYGASLPNTSVPKELKLAQVTLAGMMEAGIEIWAQGFDGVKSEKIGPLAIEYADAKADSVGNPDLPQIESILQPLFAPFSPNFIVTR